VTESSIKESFSNDHLSIQVERKPGCQVSMSAKVSKEGTDAAFKKALKNVKKEVSIPGFRKGKAPEDVVRKNFATAIDDEWKRLIKQTTIHEALELTKIEPLSNSSVYKLQITSLSKEEGAELVIELESYPQIPTVDIDALETEPAQVEPVTDEDIMTELNKQQLNRATYSDIEGRPVQENDYIHIDLDVLDMPARNVFKDRLFHVTKEEMPEWAYDAVLGMNVDEVNDIQVTSNLFGEEVSDKEEEMSCRITLTAIKSAELPELNDTFAQEFKVDTLDELKERIRNFLQHQNELYVNEESRALLAKELLQKYIVDVPQSLLNYEKNLRLKQAEELTKKEAAIPEEDGKIKKEHEEEAFFRAFSFLSLLYLMTPIVEKENFPILQDEFLQELIADSSCPNPLERTIGKDMTPEVAHHRIFVKLRTEKALDFILEQKKKKSEPVLAEKAPSHEE